MFLTPKHTFGSVISSLIAGLESGTITLDSDSESTSETREKSRAQEQLLREAWIALQEAIKQAQQPMDDLLREGKLASDRAAIQRVNEALGSIKHHGDRLCDLIGK